MAKDDLNNKEKRRRRKKIRERSFLPGYTLKVGIVTNATSEYVTLQIDNHKLNFALDVFEENANELKNLIGKSTVVAFNSKRDFKAVTSPKTQKSTSTVKRKRAKHMRTWA